MNVDMDSIVVSIESTTEKASSAIDDLVKHLEDLQTALSNVAKSSNDLKKLKDNIPNISGRTSTAASLNKSNLNDQLDKLKINLKDYDVASVFKSESTKGITSEITKYKNAQNDVVTVQKKMRDGMEDYYRVTKKTTTDGVSAFEKFRNSIASVVSNITKLYFGITRAWNVMQELTETSAEYTEAVNLFYTEMGEKAQDAEKWVTRFSEALYLDPSDVMQYMGAFNSLVSGLGVGVENSYKMSKNLTQLAYDLASYKNLSFEQAYDKLSSGIAGQIKGLRQVGVALSQNTLQELANELGIQQRITTMDEASKAQLRYIQIMRSSTNWQGDLGKTMMSTENILKSARQQWTLMVRALGDVAAVIVRQVMPYIIALTQLIKEAAYSLANFFGLDISFTDDFKDGTKNAGISLDAIEDGIGDVGDSADKTKKKINSMLAPFDDLNVVQTKVESAGGGSGSSGLSSLGDLPLPEYDALSKLTSEWSDKIADAKKKLESIIPIAKKLLTAIGAIWAIGKIGKFIDALKSIGSVFGLLKKPITTISGLFKTLITRFSNGYNDAKALGTKGLPAILSGTRNLLGPFGKLSVAAATTAASFTVGYKEMEKYASGTESLGTSLGKTLGVTATFSAVAFALGGLPAAAATALGGLIGAYAGYVSTVEDAIAKEQELQNVFSKTGVRLEYVQGFFEQTTIEMLNSSNKIEEARKKYENVSKSVDTAKDSVEQFKEQLIVSGEEISKADYQKLIDGYNQVGNAIVNSAKEEFNYTKTITEEAKKRGIISDEEAKKQIDNAALVLNTTKQSEESRKKTLEMYKAQLDSNMITEEEYRKKVERLNEIYGITETKLTDVSTAEEYFKLMMEKGINTKNYNDLNDIINDLGKNYDNTTKQLKRNYDSTVETQKAIVDNATVQIAAYKSLLQEATGEEKTQLENQIKNEEARIRNATAAKENAYKIYADSMNKTTQFYGDSLTAIYAKINSGSSKLSSDMQKTSDNIQSKIEGITDKNNYKFDFSGISGKATTNLMDSVAGSGSDSLISHFVKAMNKVGVSGTDELVEAYAKTLEGKKDYMRNHSYNLTKDIDAGYSDGIFDITKGQQKRGQEYMEPFITGSRNALDSHSPSVVYEKMGRDVMLGFEDGLNNTKKQVLNAMTNILKELNTTTSKTLKELKFEINTTSFQNSLNNLLGKLQTFSTKFRTGVNSLLSSFTTSMNGIKVGGDNKIYYTQMPNIYIPRFDEGGYPDRASLFWANENGIPEMVGQIGNRTAVANNDQITTAMTNALIEALSGMNFGGQGTTIVNIGNEKVYEGMGEYIDGENERYGTAYVNL